MISCSWITGWSMARGSGGSVGQDTLEKDARPWIASWERGRTPRGCTATSTPMCDYVKGFRLVLLLGRRCSVNVVYLLFTVILTVYSFIACHLLWLLHGSRALNLWTQRSVWPPGHSALCAQLQSLHAFLWTLVSQSVTFTAAAFHISFPRLPAVHHSLRPPFFRRSIFNSIEQMAAPINQACVGHSELKI